MRPRRADLGRKVLLAGLAGGYLVLAHYTTATSGAAALGVVLSIAPLLGGLLVFAWRSPLRWPTLAACTFACAGLWHYWTALEHNFAWLYFAQHAGTNALLALAFGRTLAPGQDPLCTRLARILHDTVPPEVVRYTRQVTVAWTTYFGLTAALSVLLFAFAPLEIWSVFGNLMTAPLIGLMFVGEYAIRKRVLPASHHSSIQDTIRAFRSFGKPAETPPPVSR